MAESPADTSEALATFVSLLAGAGGVRTALAAVLEVPDLQIAYWLPESERWVDRDGVRQVVEPAEPGVTLLTHHGEPVAALQHDPGLAVVLEEPLATAVPLALENERLQLALRSRLEEQASLRRVATVVAGQHAPEEVFSLVAREVAGLLDADAALTARYAGPGDAIVLAEWSAPGVGHFPAGEHIAIGGETALAKVQRTGAPARVDSYDGMPGEYPAVLRALGWRAAVAAPILVDGRLWGAVGAGSAGVPFARDAEARLGAFAELVAQAIANVDARMQLNASRARIVEAADEARRRLERDLAPAP